MAQRKQQDRIEFSAAQQNHLHGLVETLNNAQRQVNAFVAYLREEYDAGDRQVAQDLSGFLPPKEEDNDNG